MRIQLNKSIQWGLLYEGNINRRTCDKFSTLYYRFKDTVRGAAVKFGISKSTVHKDVSERLIKINPSLAKEVREILDENKAERHIRGGMATKLKYSHLKNKSKTGNSIPIQEQDCQF